MEFPIGTRFGESEAPAKIRTTAALRLACFTRFVLVPRRNPNKYYLQKFHVKHKKYDFIMELMKKKCYNTKASLLDKEEYIWVE